jgi:hypothetical protein
MKLTDILRQINEEEEDTQQGPKNKIFYDPAVKPVSPSTIQDIVNALTDPNNYDKTLKTKFSLRDTGAMKEPLPKSPNLNGFLKLAKEEWNKLSEDGKLRKIKNIKNRVFIQTIDKEHVPNYAGKKAWEENIVNNEAVQDAYNDWENEGNEGSIESYLSSLSFDELRNTGLLGTKGVNYWPQKPYTKDDEILLNQATMREGENFIVTNDRVIFPLIPNKPFLGTQGEQGLKDIVNSILKNAKVSVEQADVVRGTTSSTSSSTEPTPTEPTPTKPKAEEVPPLTVTADTKDKADKFRDLLRKEIGEVPTAKYEIEPVEIDGVRKYKVIVTGISKDQRQKLLIKKSTLKEEVDFDYGMHRMRKIAGL